MPSPRFCIACLSKNNQHGKNFLKLHNNYDLENEKFENYKFSINGICGTYECPHEDCNAIYDIIDLYTDKNKTIRIIKYHYESNKEYCRNTEVKMISNCLYCADKLIKINSVSDTKITTPTYECDGKETLLHCPNCNTKYNIIDFISPKDNLYESRDITII